MGQPVATARRTTISRASVGKEPNQTGPASKRVPYLISYVS